MSRVGKRIINLPSDTKIEINKKVVTVTGKLGTLTREFSPLIAISMLGNEVSTSRANDEKHTKQLHGTTNSLLSGMVIGVSTGYKKELEIKGVGYRAILKNNQVEINTGFSHPVIINVIDGVKVEIPKPTIVIVSGIDKQAVGQMAALIRNVRRPNPYSGKGIMYKSEQIRRKEGKAAAK